jgi:hypothetical protein
MQKKTHSLIRFRQLAATVATALAFAAATACGGDDPEPAPEVNCDLVEGAQTYVAGLEAAGTDVTVRLLESIPGPPVKGINTWRLQVLDSVDAPLDGLEVTVTPYMPSHGHGTTPAEVTEQVEPGEYEVTPVDLRMPGLWETTIEVSDGADLDDSVVFSFCVEG